MRQGFRVARVAGVTVRAHWSVLLIAGMLAWGLAEGIVPVSVPGTPALLAWGVGLLAAALLLILLTLHELGHSLVARRLGMRVDDITLWLFGGVSHVHDDWATAGAELRIAAAGPLVSLGVTLLLLGATFAAAALSLPQLLQVLVQWLFLANTLLLVFNLLPAFPLDGGRILRALVWRLRGDRDVASRVAARAGRAFAFLIIGLGVADFFLFSDPAGFWLVLVGWFLDGTSRREQQGETVRRLLHGVRVQDAMSRTFVRVPAWITLDLLLDQYVTRGGASTFITHAIDGQNQGLVTLHAIQRVPARQRSARRAADIAVPLGAVPSASPGEMLTNLLARMTPQSEGRGLVVDSGQVVGVVSPGDVARMLSSIAPRPGMRPLPPPPPLPPAPETPAPPPR